MAEGSLFITFEGLDGSGKTTIARHLAHYLETALKKPIKFTYEPHNPSCGGDYIRKVLEKKIKEFTPYTLMLAFAANRLDHCNREINPWLEEDHNQILICDRYYLSSLVYQSNEAYSFKDIMDINRAARKPDLTIFMNVSNTVCLQRMRSRNRPTELFEKNLSETRTKYLNAIQYLKESRDENIAMVDADGSIENVLKEVLSKVTPMLSREEKSKINLLPIQLSKESYPFEKPWDIDLQIDHIGIAVQNLRDTLKMYRQLFNLEPFHSELIPDQKVRASFIQIGDQKLELIEATSEESPINKYISKKGEGMHHIAYQVQDIHKAMEVVSSRGFRLIDKEPRKGAMDKWIAFIHPKDTHGVLIELCQSTKEME